MEKDCCLTFCGCLIRFSRVPFFISFLFLFQKQSGICSPCVFYSLKSLIFGLLLLKIKLQGNEWWKILNFGFPQFPIFCPTSLLLQQYMHVGHYIVLMNANIDLLIKSSQNSGDYKQRHQRDSDWYQVGNATETREKFDKNYLLHGGPTPISGFLQLHSLLLSGDTLWLPST